jgi:hypothetical protein
MEETIIKELIKEYADNIGLELKINELNDIYNVYQGKKYIVNDIESILMNELYELQEIKTESQVLLLN